MATLGIDLTALSVGELQRLLASARARGEAALTNRLLAEVAARRTLPATIYSQRMGDRPGPDAQTLPHERKAAAPRRVLPLALGMVAIALASTGFGWWLGQPTPGDAAPSPAVNAEPPPLIAAIGLGEAETPGLPVSELAAPTVYRLAPSPPSESKPAPAAKMAAHKATRPARVRVRREGLDCGLARGRVDRLVCGDRALSARHRQMRMAYEHALVAGADRRTVDRGQAQWRKARSQTANRRALTVLYDRRIQALEAAATRAKRRR